MLPACSSCWLSAAVCCLWPRSAPPADCTAPKQRPVPAWPRAGASSSASAPCRSCSARCAALCRRRPSCGTPISRRSCTRLQPQGPCHEGQIQAASPGRASWQQAAMERTQQPVAPAGMGTLRQPLQPVPAGGRAAEQQPAGHLGQKDHLAAAWSWTCAQGLAVRRRAAQPQLMVHSCREARRHAPHLSSYPLCWPFTERHGGPIAAALAGREQQLQLESRRSFVAGAQRGA